MSTNPSPTPSENRPSDPLCLINEDCIFTSTEKFNQFLAFAAHTSEPAAETFPPSTEYNIIGILGGQSTGKSTLLNALFGTTFPVMDEDAGRYQTTKGLWLAHAHSSSTKTPLFVMDAEGTDGRERFDDQTFERRASLFSLATCDLLVINLLSSEVGRYNAANLSLLRCIMELYLQLFSKSVEHTNNGGEESQLEHTEERQSEETEKVTERSNEFDASTEIRNETPRINEETPKTEPKVPVSGHRRMRLLFILRDHVKTSFDTEVTVLEKSLRQVWSGVYRSGNATPNVTPQRNTDRSNVSTSKRSAKRRNRKFHAHKSHNSGLAESSGHTHELPTDSTFEPEHMFEDYFDVSYFALPHYQLQRSEFDQQIETLKHKFRFDAACILPSLPLRAARPCGRGLDVPLEALYIYMSNCWATICDNKEIDIPSQKELIAVHRCAELRRDTLTVVEKMLSEWNAQLRDKKPIPRLMAQVRSLAHAHERQMQHRAELYPRHTVSKLSHELHEEILRQAEPILEAQLQLVLSSAQSSLEAELFLPLDRILQAGLPVETTWPQIRELLQSLRKGLILRFIRLQEKAQTLDEALSDSAISRLELNLEITFDRRLRALARDAHKHMASLFEYALHHKKDGALRVYPSLAGLMKRASVVEKLGVRYLENVCCNRLKNREWDSSVGIKIEGPNVHLCVPLSKTWSSDVEKALQVIKSGGEVSEDKANTEEIDHGDVVPLILQEWELQRAYELYKQQTQFTVQLLQRTMESPSRTHIPLWFWALFAFFAFDDVCYMLTSPLWLMLALTLGYLFLHEWISERWEKLNRIGDLLQLQNVLSFLQPLSGDLKTRKMDTPPDRSTKDKANKRISSSTDSLSNEEGTKNDSY